MAHEVYRPKTLPVQSADGRRVPALVFIARREHRQYVGELAAGAGGRAGGAGSRGLGTALDYLRNVVRHLDEFGINDCPLRRVMALAEAKATSATGDLVA